MIWVKLLIPLILFGTVQASTRMCAQCVAGDFMFRRHLMQDSSVGMSMGWIEEWKNTNCVKGIINTIPCDHACLKITIIKSGDEKDAIDGVMMDCSDFMIHSSPDLPKHIDFTAYDENSVFSSMRRNFTITYNFTMQGFEGVDEIAEAYKAKIFPYYREDYDIATILILIFMFVCVIACVAVFCSCSAKDICNKDKGNYHDSLRVQYTAHVDELIHQPSDHVVTPSSPSAPSDDVEIQQKSGDVQNV